MENRIICIIFGDMYVVWLLTINAKRQGGYDMSKVLVEDSI